MPPIERFQLFNACRPMRLTIAPLNDYVAAIGLTKEALQAAAESRLRAARLYTEDRAKADYSWLYVTVHVVGRAFSTTFLYHKTVTDEFGETLAAPTWGSRKGSPARTAGMQATSSHPSRGSWTSSWPSICASTNRPAAPPRQRPRHLCKTGSRSVHLGLVGERGEGGPRIACDSDRTLSNPPLTCTQLRSGFAAAHIPW